MSKSKAGGKTKQKTPRAGKRLGIKCGHGKTVKPGDILVRQRGSKFYPGLGVKRGRDFTLFSKIAGKVSFRQRQGKKLIDVVN